MTLDYSDHTFNIALGCCKVSPGCAHCYAEEDQIGFGRNNLWGKNASRMALSAKHWKGPQKWNEAAKGAKERPLVICCSMGDVFEDHPTIDQERKKLWDLIQATPNLDWHLITKREDNVENNLPWGKTGVPWSNVWISMSIENDIFAKRRLPYLSRLNVVVRGAHVEPLLGPIPTLAQYINQLDWVLVGGESRDTEPTKARAMQPIWVKEIQKICDGAEVPFMFKQWGSQKPVAVNADSSIKFEAMKRWEAGNIFLKKTWKGWPVPKIGKPREGGQ